MKKILCFLLIAVVCLSVMPTDIITANARNMVSAAVIVENAKSLIDKYPYVYGGESPAEGGFDCTGLVWYVYNQMSGVDISLSQAGRSKSALANAGTKITDISNFLPGDIVQFDYPHVGIYIGNNTIIEARKSGTRVNYRAINSYSQVSYAIRLSTVTQGQTTNVTEEKRPDKPVFKDVDDSYTTSTGATFYWNNVSNATTYGLILDKYNDATNSYEWYESYWNINSGYNQALPAGKYKAVMQAIDNSNDQWLWTASDEIYFSVVENENGAENNPIEDTKEGDGKGNTDKESAEYAGKVHFPYVNNYYKGTFSDIREGQWYTDSVANAYKLGLMKGDSPTSFNPHGDVTIAEAITMAARIHCIYTTKKENFVQSGKWYQVYLDYALGHNIINNGYYNCDVTASATRAQFAEIFANALPEEGLMQINIINNNSIPDIPASAHYGPNVYKLYKAGILTGSDVLGTFAPSTFISRKEAATIVSRMADSDKRINFQLE